MFLGKQTVSTTKAFLSGQVLKAIMKMVRDLWELLAKNLVINMLLITKKALR